jgi:hypothetical protein
MTEKSDKYRQATSELIREVRARIWAWDPVGLADLGAPEDEYDRLVGPVTGGLRQGLPADAFADRLRRYVQEDFAIEPRGTESFVADLLTWYQQLEGDSKVW